MNIPQIWWNKICTYISFKRGKNVEKECIHYLVGFRISGKITIRHGPTNYNPTYPLQRPKQVLELCPQPTFISRIHENCFA